MREKPVDNMVVRDSAFLAEVANRLESVDDDTTELLRIVEDRKRTAGSNTYGRGRCPLSGHGEFYGQCWKCRHELEGRFLRLQAGVALALVSVIALGLCLLSMVLIYGKP